MITFGEDPEEIMMRVFRGMGLAFAALVLMGSCETRTYEDLGNGYYFYYDGRGSDILHSETTPVHGEGLSIVPPTVSDYWYNDTTILARRMSHRAGGVVDYWIVLKSRPITWYPEDATGIKRPANVVGPIDSLSFYRELNRLGLQPRWTTGYHESH